LPYFVTELKSPESINPNSTALYFKKDKGESFAVGRNFGNRFGDANDDLPLKKIQLPVFLDNVQEEALEETPEAAQDEAQEMILDEAQHQAEALIEAPEVVLEGEPDLEDVALLDIAQVEEPEEIIDAKIYASVAWYLTNKGFIYKLEEEAYLKWAFEEKIIKLQSINQGNRADHYKFYAVCESGKVLFYDSYKASAEWGVLPTSFILGKTSKPYRNLTNMVFILQKQGLFKPVVEHAPRNIEEETLLQQGLYY